MIDGTPIRFPPEFQWRTFDASTTTFIANNPSGSTVALWTGSNEVAVRFEEAGGRVSFSFASSEPLTLAALDSSGNTVVTETASANLQPDGFTAWDLVKIEVVGNWITELRVLGAANATVIDDFTGCFLALRTVGIDIKPGNADDIDPLNLKSQGALPVAVLSAADFDATTVDVTTLELGDPLLVARAHVVDSSAQDTQVEDVNQDGLADLVVHFSATELVDGGAIDANTTSVVLTGSTLSGEAIEGTDQVRIVGGGH